MRENIVKRKLAQGDVTLGCWMGSCDPAVAEVLAGVGFDFVIIDSEHAPLSPGEVQNLLMGFTGSETVPIVRVAWNDFVLIKLMLDVGASGVLVPMVNSAEEAKSAVAACKYPPQGIRGVGPRRAGRYGVKFLEYMERANDEILVVAQMENISAVERLEEILGVEGLDAIFVGPADLTASMGLLPQFGHPKVLEAMDGILAKCLEMKVPFGVAADGVEDARGWIAKGGQFIAFGGDLGYIQRGAARALSKARRD